MIHSTVCTLINDLPFMQYSLAFPSVEIGPFTI